ncbi:MAG: AAA family ATPase [Acidobacteriota bacterium]|nr:AAA family ATPase [Acidobacteriota bacterium]
MSASATPFASQHGQACISVPIGVEAHQVVPLRSHRFRNWLIESYLREYGVVPGSGALRDALRALEARALCFDSPRRHVDARVTSLPRRLTLDLANNAGDVVEITPGSWRVTDGLSSFAASPRGAQPLPAPIEAPAAALQQLRPLLNLPSHGAWLRCVAWLLACMRPGIPAPVLVLTGPPGSGKSSTARLLRSLIDPIAATFQPLPAFATGLLALAATHRVLAFDHVTRLPRAVADALCRVSSGAAVDLDHGPEPVPARLSRPILLTAPEPPTDRALSDRALVVRMPAIAPPNRRTESALANDFERLRPALLGALCTAAAAALARIDSIHLSAPPRMADFAAWCAAAAPALAVSESEFLTALHYRPDEVATAIEAFMQSRTTWTGSATELLAALALSGTPRALSHRLRNLELIGLHLRFSRLPGGDRRISIIPALRDADPSKFASQTALREPQVVERSTAVGSSTLSPAKLITCSEVASSLSPSASLSPPDPPPPSSPAISTSSRLIPTSVTTSPSSISPGRISKSSSPPDTSSSLDPSTAFAPEPSSPPKPKAAMPK